ncbi:MAG: hypothetical protein N3J91_10750 [Verrucomicrobiae bacterium]|nr:hypothetical protein [Verrucomicrobiae bacterium]
MATRITNAVELKSLAATLHDARFTADSIAFDATARTFTLKCWVLQPASRRWQARQLSFGGVADSKVNVKEKVRYYELATIRFAERDRKLEFVAHYGIEISLAVDKLDGALNETNETRDKWE